MYGNPPEAVAVVGGAPLGWWTRQSTPKKVAIVAGSVAGVSLAVWGIRRMLAPEPIRDISDGCNDFAFANEAEVEETIIPLLKSARTRTGHIDPFYVTTRFLRKFAPDCRSYPEEARNVGEALLYVQSFVKVVNTMEGERMLSPDQKGYFLGMVSVWGRTQGLSAEELPVSSSDHGDHGNGNGNGNGNGTGAPNRTRFADL